MKDLCLECDKRSSCKEPCKKVSAIIARDFRRWRRGDERKMILWDFRNTPDPDSVDEPPFRVDMGELKLTERQQKVLDMILEGTTRELLVETLGESRWVINKEIRSITREISRVSK